MKRKLSSLIAAVFIGIGAFSCICQAAGMDIDKEDGEYSIQVDLDKDVVVIGISKDSIKSHTNFAKKHDLPFILLSDPELEAIKAYDVWQEKKLYGKVSMGVVRTTYIIDENGMIEKVYDKVKTDKNVGEVLEYLG